MAIRIPQNLTDFKNQVPPGVVPIIGNVIRDKLEPGRPGQNQVPPRYEKQKFSEEVSLSNAIASLRRKGIAKSNRYIVLIATPAALEKQSTLIRGVAQQAERGVLSDGFMRAHIGCENAEMPGIQIATQEQMLYSINEKMPYQILYDEVTLTYRVDADMREKQYFDMWINGIVNPVNGNIEYRNNYVTDIEIIQLDMKNEDVYAVKLIDAYPTAIATLPMGYDQANTYHRISVTFAYKKYITLGRNRELPPDVVSAELKASRSPTPFERAKEEFGKLAQSKIGTELIKQVPIGNIPGIGSVSDITGKIYGLLP